MSPEERSERLAELKARRRARLRKAAIGTGIGLAALLLVVLIAAYWLLQTVAGRDVLMAQVQARLPAGSSLTWSRLEGPLAGPLILHDLDFKYDGLQFSAGRAYLDPDIRPLLGRKLRLDALQLRDAHLELGPPSDEPFELPRWPDVLPSLEVPLSIQADTIAVDNLRVTQLGEPMVAVHKLRGGLTLADGELRATALKVNTDMGDLLLEGHYNPRKDYDTDLVARALVPMPEGGQARLGLAVRGNLGRMEVALAGHAPQPVHAMLILEGREQPRWRAFARGDRLELGHWLPGAAQSAPLSLQLAARGEGGQARLQGRVQQGGQDIVLAPSNIAIENQVLRVSPLVVQAFGGTIGARGTADFSDSANPAFRLSLSMEGLNWTPPAEGDAPPVPLFLRQALLGVAGTANAWAVYGTADIAREQQQAALKIDARGSQRGAFIQELVATTPGGKASIEGKVGWEPVLAWEAKADLDGFDPGYFLPGWDGKVSGQVVSNGARQPAADPSDPASPPGPLQASVDIPRLHGQLRGRALQASAALQLEGEQAQGQIDLSLGNSHVQAKGRVGNQLDVQAQLQPLQLDDLLPGASGSLAGSLQLRGRTDSPDIHADLQGSGLRWGDYQAQSLSLVGELPWQGHQGQLALRASGLQAGMALDSVQLDASGNLQQLALQGNAGNELGRLALQGSVGQTTTGWAGNVQALQIDPAKGAAWALREPAQFRLDGQRLRLADACLGAATGGALCVAADWPGNGLSVSGDALPLSLVQPWLPLNEGRRTHLRGEITLDGQLRPQGNAFVGQFKIISAEGGVRLGDNARGEVVRYDNFNSTIELTPQAINAYVGVGFAGDGFVDARVSTGWSDSSPLVGDVYLNMSRLYWLELFSADLVRPTGLLEGHVSLRGERGQPQIGGQAKLSNFAGEFPAMGLNLSEGSGELVAQADGSARIQASVKTGGTGALRVDGGLSLFGQEQPLQLDITGEQVLVANTPELRIVANPNLRFTLDAQAMKLEGRVQVPEASIDLERLDRGTSTSEDVVVLDPVDPEDGPSSPLDMNLAISLGDQVRMSGFGLKGTLAGELQVVSRPGREMTANGQLEVGGRYKAYGQDLTITDGRLLWNHGVVSDPRIAIRARREIGDVTAGIHVSGRAMQPRVEIWSEPSMSQSEALSYLVLGRSLSMASADQMDQVSAASAALSAGSGLLASQIGARLGFDDAGVSQSRALGGAVLGVGKYITPKLYVGYGVSMIGSGSVLTLKYLLRKGFDIEVESSTVENRGSVNWRTEK
ncbi:MAG: translocation/assembly module TamB domain-containing protein [Stenotrophomonas sp.]